MCCPDCDNSPSLPRRNFLKLAGGAALGLAIPGGLKAAPPATPPRPQNVISSEAALERLLKGNARYVSGDMKIHDFVAERPALVAGQNPFAGILSCADSRIAPEYAFDTGRGDLFVCRVAGNFANADTIASFEFGVAVLGVPLIVVLGHESCGAIDSTIKAVNDGAKFPGHIPSLVKALTPAVKAAQKQTPANLLKAATKENVLLTVEKLKSASPVLDKALAQNRLRVVGGVYNLATGHVDWLG